jgi:[ribosomal protein S5]-alanine N-acetyltransferase
VTGDRQRVYITPPAAADEAEFVAAMRASAALHRPWLSPPRTPETFRGYLSRAQAASFDGNLVRRSDDGALVGYFNISEIIRGALQGAFLGYGAVAMYAGRGYMRAGLELVLQRAFVELGLHRLEANIQPANTASIALVRGAGFVREGFSPRFLKIDGAWRDHERWAIRFEQWLESATERVPVAVIESARGRSREETQ